MGVHFHHPEHLWALAVLAVPIIVHLFNFRRHKLVYFSNVSFLRTIKVSTKNYSKLQRLLILLSRLLLFASVVVAFAQPYLPKNTKEKSASQLVGIYIDNSFSMNAESSNGRLLDQAIAQARAVLSAYAPQTDFVYLNNDENSEHFHLLDKSKMLDELMKTEISPSVLSMEKLQDNFVNITKDFATHKKLYVISDFQKSTLAVSAFNAQKDSVEVIFLPVASQTVDNICIDSCWFTNNTHSFGQDEIVNLRVCNYSSKAVAGVPVKLYVNDTMKSMAQASVEAYSKEVVQLVYKNKSKGAVYCKAELQDFPILFDNNLYFSYFIRPRIKVLLISEGEGRNYIAPVFQDEAGFELVQNSSTQINYAEFAAYNCIIVDGLTEISSGLAQELLQFAERGNTVMVIPGQTIANNSYNYFLSATGLGSVAGPDTSRQELSYIAQEDPLFLNVFDEIRANSSMPSVGLLHPLLPSRKCTPVLKTKQGDILLAYSPMKSGRVFWLSVPYIKENLDFVSHPVSLPSIYNAALYSTVKSKSYYTIGIDQRVDISADYSSDELLSIKNNSEGNRFIPQKRKNMLTNATELYVFENIAKHGHYSVMQNNELVLPFSYNYARKESNISLYPIAELAETVNAFPHLSMFDQTGNLLTEEIRQNYQGVELSFVFVIMSLLFLVLELLLIRFWFVPKFRKKNLPIQEK